MAGNKMKWPERHVAGRYVLPHMLVGEAFDGDGNILEDHVRIVMELSMHETLDLLSRLTEALRSGFQVSSHTQIVMYLKTELEYDRRVPDEFFRAKLSLHMNYIDMPEKLIWTREELKSDFPPGEPPVFDLQRYLYSDGAWSMEETDYKEVFGWEDDDG